ncbi:phosphoadenosine phosphosulfate reductase family protein [Methanolobus mangrovi]|uniref:Phosphoadenosine phosphosulfate reductase family protein n=1 Tax=Methanolobus mangrovi TaxID=3072977 RepID=A0AA51UEU5_9EURY|nr:phosphoadenosine phosphosulfate reductase family protein [Methanolobus mangrovi]WMW21654.1 phosphoadenosine phosphosulfate reductase family protein [Methanolobus mangrovi]
MSKALYLGELLLYWCPSCNVPVLGKECSCGTSTKQVTVTPPGDIRPAFPYDIDLVNKLSIEQFNAPLITDERVVVMNKSPYDDRMDEVIVDGEVIGTIRFELEHLKWVLLLRLNGARRIFDNADHKTLKSWVSVDEGAEKFILGGASLLAPGVKDADPSIEEMNEVVVLTHDGKVLGTGRSRMSGEQMLERGKGVAVKVRSKEEPAELSIPCGGQTWDDVVKANEVYMNDFVDRSRKFIENVASSVNRPATVSYSGGKDSLAVLHLVSECLDDYTLLFADTGIEFPETVQNVHDVAQRYGKPLNMISSGDAFWDSVDSFGPPSVEVRWCCKVCKLGPITQIINDNYEGGCLTFIGQRKYESSTRAKSERVWKNPWVGNQVAAAPIQSWTAMHVWLYIFKNDLLFNPMYENGFDRIGCWLCPSCSLADLVRLKETHPEMEKKLNDYLLPYAQRMGLSEEWVKHGFWRWKDLPPQLKEIAKKKGICFIPTGSNENNLNFAITSGYRPCKQGGISAEGGFDGPVDLERLEHTGMLEAVGKASYMEGVAMVSHGEDRAQVFASGSVTARSDSDRDARRLMKKVELSVRRALLCSGCGVCVGKCSHRAIKMKKGLAIINEGCIHCGNCIDVCPVVKFNS